MILTEGYNTEIIQEGIASFNDICDGNVVARHCHHNCRQDQKLDGVEN